MAVDRRGDLCPIAIHPAIEDPIRVGTEAEVSRHTEHVLIALTLASGVSGIGALVSWYIRRRWPIEKRLDPWEQDV